MAVEIAKGEPQEDGGGSERGSFALQGVEDLGRSIRKAGYFHGLEEGVCFEKSAQFLGLIFGEIDKWEAEFIGAMTL